MNSIENILHRLNEAGLQVRGLGYFRDYKGARQVALPDSEGEWKGLTLNEEYTGYLRAASPVNYSADGRIGCDTRIYDTSQDISFVIWHSREQAAKALIDVALRSLGDIELQSITLDRQQILNEESIPENDYGLIKISFRLLSKFVGSECPVELCAGYFDPCYDSPSCIGDGAPFSCEQVKECVPDLISEDEGNAATVGSDGGIMVELPEPPEPIDVCEQIEECENFTTVRDTANAALSGLGAKANTADLGAVAFTNDYNDLDNLPPQQLPLTIASDLSENAFTDTGTDIIMSTLFIPANTFDPTNLYKLIYEAGVYRDASGAAAGVLNMDYCINTTPNVGGIFLLGNNSANTNRWNYMERTIVLREGNVIAINNRVANDNLPAISIPNIVPIDLTVDQYIMLYVSQNQAGVRLSNIEASLILVAEETP